MHSITAINPARNRLIRFGTVCCVVLGALAGCGSALVQCKLEAVEKLPDDPFAVSGHDVANLVARLQNCRAQAGADAGAP